MTSDDVLDETYERLHRTGPEFEGWLSNHGPMAADALIRMGCADEVEPWLDGYVERLETAPTERWRIEESQWREVLGDPSRLGDWCALFAHETAQGPWREVLLRWWPRLIDGAVASASHGLIRTGHAVRALSEKETPQRIQELAAALAYWAARWQPLPEHPRPHGSATAGEALDRVPVIAGEGGIRTRLALIDRTPAWAACVADLAAPDPAEVPDRLDDLVDAAVARYPRWAHGNPVMLVHAATAPRAVSLVLPALPRDLWPASYDAAWTVSAAIGAAYRPGTPPPTPPRPVTDPAELVQRAADTADEHAIKFAEVALESYRRGRTGALGAGAVAADLIGGG